MSEIVKTCENCRFGKIDKYGTYCIIDVSCVGFEEWRPNYQTLEAETTESKRELEVHKLAVRKAAKCINCEDCGTRITCGHRPGDEVCSEQFVNRARKELQS